MAYTPTDWVDGVTPINAANLDKLEGGVQAAAAVADGAIPKALVDAKGDILVATAADVVARLAVGADGQALVADAAQAAGVKWATPAAAGGGGTDWEGAYNPATAYVKGDVVTYNGVTYAAVNDSTGQTPPAAVPISAPLVTALPATPFDGQEVILTDSLTVPTFTWRLRYVAAKAANKWVFVGGAAIRTAVDTPESTTTPDTYVDLATPGPSFTVPVAGIYAVHFGYTANVPSAAWGAMSVKLGAAATTDAYAAWFRNETGTTNASPSQALQATLAASAVLKAQYKSIGGIAIDWRDRWLEVEPVAVGG